MKHTDVLALGGPLHGRLVDHHSDGFVIPTDPPDWGEGIVELHSYEVVHLECHTRGALKVFAHEEVTWGQLDKARSVLEFLEEHPPEAA